MDDQTSQARLTLQVFETIADERLPIIPISRLE
ncbi:hypothetical protein RLDS_02090 [Sphingobium lactosutens DS20]|uniref:Uncharacterized protein n=1 Tax=Sphingobium lactosutens DS20 TaxID=1331060 RepID=T0HQE8_9SPHN|nr:hypothetical protein RLDS_02090 [Sphingobium lactosutens DS20]